MLVTSITLFVPDLKDHGKRSPPSFYIYPRENVIEFMTKLVFQVNYNSRIESTNIYFEYFNNIRFTELTLQSKCMYSVLILTRIRELPRRKDGARIFF